MPRADPAERDQTTPAEPGTNRTSGRATEAVRQTTGLAADDAAAPRGRRLVVKSGAGADDAERCAQAITVASTAAASGVDVSLWLMGDAVHLARPGVATAVELAHAPPLDQLLDVVLASGTVTVCTQCAARRDLGADDFLPGVQIAGAATYVEEILQPHTQAITY